MPRIEHDAKIMFAGMLQGDYISNLMDIIDEPLGPVLNRLEKLDNSDHRPYLRENDYALLREIRINKAVITGKINN